MSLKYKDDAAYVTVSLIGKRMAEIEALIDTGADMSGIPIQKCVEVGFEVEGFRLFRGLFGAGFLPVFRGRVELKGISMEMAVVGLLNGESIVGRDLLSNFKLSLDWKGKKVEIEDPPFKRATLAHNVKVVGISRRLRPLADISF